MVNLDLFFNISAVVFALCLRFNFTAAHDSVCPCEEEVAGLDTYNADQIARHDSIQTEIWASYKNGVYNLSSFIDKHPGGVGKVIFLLFC